MRYPGFETLVGAHVPPKSNWHNVVAHGGGMYRSNGELTGAARWSSVHSWQDYNLVVDVSFSEAAALRWWQTRASRLPAARSRWRHVLLLLFRALIIQVRRLARSEAALAQRNAEQEVARARLESQSEALRRSEADAAEKSALLRTTLEFMDQGIAMVNADRASRCATRASCKCSTCPPSCLPRGPTTPTGCLPAANRGISHDPDELDALLRPAASWTGRIVRAPASNGMVLEIRTTPLPGGGVGAHL